MVDPKRSNHLYLDMNPFDCLSKKCLFFSILKTYDIERYF